MLQFMRDTCCVSGERGSTKVYIEDPSREVDACKARDGANRVHKASAFNTQAGKRSRRTQR